MKHFKILLVFTGLLLTLPSVAFSMEKPQLMRFVCRAINSAANNNLDPHFAITVEQTSTFELDGKTYDGRSLVPGNKEFAGLYELIDAEIPVKIKIFKSASSVLSQGNTGSALFDSLNSSNLSANEHSINESMVMNTEDFSPKWTDSDGRSCYVNYYYERPGLRQYSCNKNGVVEFMKALKCDPAYLIDAPPTETEDELLEDDEEVLSDT